MKKNNLSAVVANKQGEIFDLDGYAAVGMAGDHFFPIDTTTSIKSPHGTELMYLADRYPVVFNLSLNKIETLETNPYLSDQKIFPVAAFNSPGYVINYTSAFYENKDANQLPLFSYGAVGWHNDNFYSSALQIDKEKRQDLRLMSQKKIIAGIKRLQKQMPKNRLRMHLEKCALEYSCPAAKNFFLRRYEAPLPTSKTCNANCIGCISLQKDEAISSCQQRIAFTPKPDEIADIALEHISNVKKSIVSFGQGCEGDPLTVHKTIAKAIKLIRKKTQNGTININTNASHYLALEELFEAGLDSVRVSLNSTIEKCYEAYFRPTNYSFLDVCKSIEIAIKNQKFVSLNYLNCPGVTDTHQEINSLLAFLEKYPINMIQWRNLNFDPKRYYKIMSKQLALEKPIGINSLINKIKKKFPKIRHGYFNPSVKIEN